MSILTGCLPFVPAIPYGDQEISSLKYWGGGALLNAKIAPNPRPNSKMYPASWSNIPTSAVQQSFPLRVPMPNTKVQL